MPLKKIAVDCNIVGSTAKVDLELTYINSNQEDPIECTYVFPLDANTLLQKFVARIDDRVIETRVKDK